MGLIQHTFIVPNGSPYPRLLSLLLIKNFAISGGKRCQKEHTGLASRLGWPCEQLWPNVRPLPLALSSSRERILALRLSSSLGAGRQLRALLF